ncbi:MAG TPA: class I SAM-dependent RNA methyltransferase [Anaerolineaceae bacterium]|nr:class I SAM-dependent RNA methyltransferase [Anaerolineaceae bacterium]
MREGCYTVDMHPDYKYEVELTAMVYGGDAMGRLPDGRAVFVPFGLPGERVRIRLVEQKRGFARAELLDLLKPAPERIPPRCSHFAICGGCHYQHLAYSDQLKLKEEIVREQLIRIAGLPQPPVLAIRPSPKPWYYRNAVQFHLSPNARIGYQKASSHEVVEIHECHLPEQVLNEVWPRLEFEPDNGLERLDVRLGDYDDLLLELEGQDLNPPDFSVDFPISAVYRGPAGQMVLSGVDYTLINILGFPFQISSGSFFQVNTPQAEAMVRHLLELITVDKSATVLDVYCGVGLFTAFLAERAGRVVGIEVAPSACEDFSANLDHFENVELYEGRAEDILPYLTLRPDIVVVDPPREGIERAALDAILAMEAPTLIYVSCDPATLGRDTKRLIKAGYQLKQVTPFDLFPQTFHVECMAKFEKNNDDSGEGKRVDDLNE